jgi:glycosyltransferase involved in cell wall biosynthesis
MFPVGFRSAIPVLAHVHADYLRRERFATLLHQAHSIVGVSESVVAPFLRDGVPAARCRVIHNGIDFAALRPARDHRLRDQLGIPREALVIGAVGSLIERKGFDLLIQAAAHLSNQNLHLVIAGDGPEKDRLAGLATQAGLQDRVHLLGYCSDVSPIYASADIAALPSRAEAFGLALVEASYFGLPVISHRLPGIAEAVLDGETGILTPVGDIPALAAAIGRLCDSAPERKRLGQAGRRHALAHFSLDRMVAQFEALYDELAGRRLRRGLPLQPYWRLLAGSARTRFKPARRPEAAA